MACLWLWFQKAVESSQKVYWHSYSNIPATRPQTASHPLAASLGNRKSQIQHLGLFYSMISVSPSHVQQKVASLFTRTVCKLDRSQKGTNEGGNFILQSEEPLTLPRSRAAVLMGKGIAFSRTRRCLGSQNGLVPWNIMFELIDDNVLYEAGANVCLIKQGRIKRAYHCCSGKAINIAYHECVSVALAIQHAKRTPLIILLSVACLVPPYFSTLSHKRLDLRKKKKKKNIKYKKQVLIFSTDFCKTVHVIRYMYIYIAMLRITTFRSTMDRMYDSGLIRLCYNILYIYIYIYIYIY